MFLFLSFTASKIPSEKGLSKRKAFTHMENKFCPFRVYHFSAGRQNKYYKVASPDSVFS